MARVARSSLPDGFFHIVARGIPETAIYRTDDDRRRFVELLRRCERKHGWICHAYCLLSTHYHVVLASRRIDLSRGLNELNGIYARGFNRRYERHGHLFSERFSTRLIESEEHLHEACSYVLLNPVKAALCEQVEQWPWSYSRIGLERS